MVSSLELIVENYPEIAKSIGTWPRLSTEVRFVMVTIVRTPKE